MTKTAHLFQQISPERYKIIVDRFEQFKEKLGDVTTEPVKVLDPLKPHLLEDLKMIREVSQDLQKKKEEHMYKLLHPEEEKENDVPATEETPTEEKKE